MKLSFVVNFNHIFVCRGIFRTTRLVGILKNNPIYTFGNFQGNIWRSSFIVKELFVPFIVKALNFTERNSSTDLTLQRKTLAGVCQIDFLKDFAKFIGKYLYRILYLIELQACSLQLNCKRDPGVNVALWILWDF